MKEHSIPQEAGMDAWNTIPIQPGNNEPLVSLSHVSDRILIRPQYYLQGIPGALNDIFLRESLVGMLLRALDHLPKGYKLVLYDGWRPLAVQTSLYNSFKQQVLQDHPDWKIDQVDRAVAQFVSLPSTEPFRPSPHLTGGSIDLTLADEHGVELNMGTPFDDFTEQSNTAYYEGQGTAEGQAAVIRENRRLLYFALTGAGFTNYYKEWWHYDYGNQFWARASGRPEAIYGAVYL